VTFTLVRVPLRVSETMLSMDTGYPAYPCSSDLDALNFAHLAHDLASALTPVTPSHLILNPSCIDRMEWQLTLDRATAWYFS
jgi:hypothetical protein